MKQTSKCSNTRRKLSCNRMIQRSMILAVTAMLLGFSSATYAAGPSRESCETNGVVISNPGQLSSGKTNLIRGGTYNMTSLTVPSGSSSSPTVVKPYNCEQVYINVTKAVEPQSNTAVSGLYIKQGGGGYGSAIRVNGNISNVIIRNNDLSNPNPSIVGGAITLMIYNGAKNITMEGNFIHDCNEDCLQVLNAGPYLIKGNEFQGPVFENLLDIKTTVANSKITSNLFRCDTLGGGCVILHGPENTSSIVVFENNLLAGCPTKIDKQLNINGKDGVDNRYDIMNNIFTANSSCRGIQFKACDGCLFTDNNFHKTTVQKGSFTGTFNLAEESGNTYSSTSYSGPIEVPWEDILNPPSALRVLSVQ